jgi:hypothetical protein
MKDYRKIKILKRHTGRESEKIHKIEYKQKILYVVEFTYKIDSVAFTNVFRPSQPEIYVYNNQRGGGEGGGVVESRKTELKQFD